MKKIRIFAWLMALLVMFPIYSCHRERKANVILVIIDTARKDHFSCYGYKRQTTPKLDELAKEGVRFEDAVATAPWTLPSVASILTGLPPHKHLAGYPGKDPKTGQEGLTYLSPSAITVTEILFQNKYQTVGSFQNPFVDPGYGLNRGFEIYDYFPGDNLRVRRADQVVDWAMAWLEQNRLKRRPFFMVLHFFDPHLAYNPPVEFMMPFVYGYQGKMKPPFAPDNEELEKLQRGEIKFSEEDRNFIIGLYNGELSFVDFSLGRFFDYLKLKGLYDQSLIIVTADHGEEFWEHGSFEHGHSLYQELLSVPLLIRFPHAENQGMVVKERVSLLDIAPSIIAYLGIDSPLEPGGRSFIKMPGAVVKPVEREVVSELNRIGDPLQAIYRDQYQLILNITSGAIEIYNLETDPGQKHNLFGEKHSYPPEIVEQMRAVAEKIKKLSQENKPLPAKISPEIIKKLKALGYLK
jgi:arylsulfatase A-like enzyme